MGRKINADKYDYIVLVICTILGGSLRILGFNWDGGHMLFQPDETMMVYPAIYMAMNKTLLYGSFKYPGLFFSKLQAACLYLYGRLNGAKIEWYSVDSYLICRLVTAVVGTATIVTIFFIGNRIMKRMGTICAVILSLSPMVVMMSKQVTGDVTVLFLLSIVMLFAISYIEEQKYRYIVYMSIFAAAATMEKWHGGGGAAFIGILIILTSKSIKDFF